ncbi:MAG: hypothetical protein ACRDQH_17990 [Pseudonocardiaceae bacterium]
MADHPPAGRQDRGAGASEPPAPSILSSNQVSQRWGSDFPPRRIARLCSEGVFPRARKFGTRWAIPLADLLLREEDLAGKSPALATCRVEQIEKLYVAGLEARIMRGLGRGLRL